MAELERKKLWRTQNGALWKEVDFSLGKVLITEKIANEQENCWFQTTFTHLISLSQKHLQNI